MCSTTVVLPVPGGPCGDRARVLFYYIEVLTLKCPYTYHVHIQRMPAGGKGKGREGGRKGKGKRSEQGDKGRERKKEKDGGREGGSRAGLSIRYLKQRDAKP
jgi:hypothetical protein